MNFKQYDVVEAMMQKGSAWESRLSEADIESVKRRVKEGKSFDDSPFKATDVARVLMVQFQDDDVMERLLLENLDRFNDFDVFISDVRLRPGEVLPDPEVLEEAREIYNAVLVQRLGLRLVEGNFEWQNPEQEVPKLAAAWASSLPDFQVAEVADTNGVPVFPKDLERILKPLYSRPDVLKLVVKKSVEEVKPLSEFIDELRLWGTLQPLDAATMVRTRHCYHALMAAGLKVDMVAEIGRRGGAEMVSSGIVEVLAAQYSEPDRIIALLEESIASGHSLAGFLAALSDEGELAQLSANDFGRIREIYAELGGGHEPSPSPVNGPTVNALPTASTAEELDDRPVVGKWTRQFSGSGESASLPPH